MKSFITGTATSLAGFVSFEQSWPIFILQSRLLVQGTERWRREIHELRAGYKKHLIYVLMFREERRVTPSRANPIRKPKFPLSFGLAFAVNSSMYFVSEKLLFVCLHNFAQNLHVKVIISPDQRNLINLP